MNQQTFQKVIWGLLFITAGVFFLLNQIGVITIKIDFGNLISTYWPVILIYFGLSGFVWQSRSNWGGSLWSLIVFFVGVMFLLKNLEVTHLSYADMMQFLGPAALIIFGISIIFKPSGKNRRKDKQSWDSEAYAQSKKEGREAWREQRAAYREQREQYKQDRNRYKQERHLYKQEHRNDKEETEASIQQQDEREKRELSEEEKEVLKDIHGEFGAKKFEEPWDLPEEPVMRGPQRRPGPTLTKENKYKDFVNNYHTEGMQYKSGFIGDVHLGKSPWELQPMMISHFIGDTIIDLTRAVIPLGETKITVSAFIGDVKIFIPNDTDVEVKVTSNSFIGDMNVLDRRESGMFRHLETQTSYYEEAPSKLIVETNMFIGDVIVKKIG
jgi:lia operon protein LiaF